MEALDYYKHSFDNDYKNCPKWRGMIVVKYPEDMSLYAQVIFEKRPDYIIETGTFHGGSAIYFADLLHLIGGKKVITIDYDASSFGFIHTNVVCIHGSSISDSVWKMINELIEPDSKIMVVLDSCHLKEHVDEELRMYAPLVTPGQYLVVEDCYADGEEIHHPYYSVRDFLKKHKDFVRHPLEEQFPFAVTKGGWLYKEVS